MYVYNHLIFYRAEKTLNIEAIVILVANPAPPRCKADKKVKNVIIIRFKMTDIVERKLETED